MKQWAEIGALKLSLYLKDKVTSEFYQKYSFILFEQATKELLLEAIKRREQQSGQLKKLLNWCNENFIAVTWIELAFLEYLLPSVNTIFECITCYHTNGVTMELAVKIALNSPDISEMTVEMVQAYQIVNKILLEDTEKEMILHRSFHVDLALMLFVEGQEFSSFREELPYTYVSKKKKLPKSILYEEQITLLSNKIKQLSPWNVPIIWLSGEKSSGRKFTAKHLAVRLEWNLFFLRASEVESLESAERKEIMSRLLRDATLFEGCICFCDIESLAKTPEKLESLCTAFLQDLPDRPFFLTTARETTIPQTWYSRTLRMNLFPCETKDRLRLWQELYKISFKEKKFPFPVLADRFDLTAGQVKSVTEKLKNDGKEEYEIEEVTAACYEVLEQGSEMVKSKTYPYTLEDLKVPAETKQLIEAVCTHANYRKKLLEDWGLKRFYAYGTCISVLMQGAPGTGKTMAAHVIANTLHMELLKIDLSQIMDKYIGETEKRLEQSFHLAEKTSRILFFDEADVLFGRRSEIHDSKDRYANNEVSYILQRLEEFEGIILLATNLSNNIDPAFLRRMRYIIPFPMPDARCRKQIWQSMFQKELPYKEIDFDFLADRFEFSGAAIKNIVFNAAVLAAKEECLTMRHIIQSLAQEYRKMGQLVIREEFAEYSKYL